MYFNLKVKYRVDMITTEVLKAMTYQIILQMNLFLLTPENTICLNACERQSN